MAAVAMIKGVVVRMIVVHAASFGKDTGRVFKLDRRVMYAKPAYHFIHSLQDAIAFRRRHIVDQHMTA
jgi:hypothetical protein